MKVQQKEMKRAISISVAGTVVLAVGAALAAENTQAEQRLERKAHNGCVTVDTSVEVGKIKVMHAVNNGPHIGKLDQYKSNEHSYKTARIPYARLHDAAFYWNWGGNHTVDIDGVFPDFDADENDPKSYDFTFTDFYLKGIRKAGTEPFYRLGQKIEHGIKKYGILPPKDFAKWARICDHIVRHYNEGWADGYHWNIKYWEIWNEPDLDWEREKSVKKGPNGLAIDPRTWGGSAEQFFDLYETTAKLLKKNHPDIKVGGPAVAWNRKWAKMFLGEMKRRGVAMDFFSWHIYTRYPASLAWTASEYRKLLDECGYRESESICNEWNYARDWQSGFVQTLEYETTMPGAAFVAGCLCAGQNSPVDMLMYYDARPSCSMNGLWDAQTLQPIWGYYALTAWSKLYADLGTQVKVSMAELNNKIHCVAAKNPETGKLGIFLVRYMEPSDEEHWKGPIRVSVKLAKGSLAGCTCHLTDASHMGSEYVPEFNDDGSITLWLMPQAFCFIEK